MKNDYDSNTSSIRENVLSKLTSNRVHNAFLEYVENLLIRTKCNKTL